jgi:hypothetical protein
MNDTEPQTAGGKVLWHFTMSLAILMGGRLFDVGVEPGETLLRSGCRFSS